MEDVRAVQLPLIYLHINDEVFSLERKWDQTRIAVWFGWSLSQAHISYDRADTESEVPTLQAQSWEPASSTEHGIRSRLHRNRPEMHRIRNDPDKYSTARFDDLGFNWSTILKTLEPKQVRHVHMSRMVLILLHSRDVMALVYREDWRTPKAWMQRHFLHGMKAPNVDFETNWGSKISDR